MKKKQPQPISNIALIDPQFASRLTGKYGWLVNRSVRGAGFVYLTPSTRAANGRGARDLHIRLQTNYANYYLKLLQTFQLEAPTITARSSASRDLQSAKRAEQVTVRAKSATMTAQAETAAVVQVRKRAQLEVVELRQVVRTLTTETARLEALRRTTRSTANQHAPMHQRPSTSRAADLQAMSSVQKTEALQASIAIPQPLVEQRMNSRQERLLRTTERTIRVSYERLTRLQTLVQSGRSTVPPEGSGSFPSGNRGVDREPRHSSIFSRQTDSKTQAADAGQRQLRDRRPAPSPIHGDQAVRRPGAASSRQAAFVHRNLRMAAWPRGPRVRQEDSAVTAAPGLSARRITGQLRPALSREAVLPTSTARPSAAVRLLPGRQLLPDATGGAPATVRRSTLAGTESYRAGVNLSSQGAVRDSFRSDGRATTVDTPGKGTSSLRQQAAAPRDNERNLAFVTSLRSAGRLSAPVGDYSRLADSVRSKLLASRLSDVIRIISLPSRNRHTGIPQHEQASTAARPRETGSGRRQAATLIYSTRERGAEMARSNRQRTGLQQPRADQTQRVNNEPSSASMTRHERQSVVAQPAKGTSNSHLSPDNGGASSPAVDGSGQQPAMTSSAPSIADEARRRQEAVKPGERRTERADQAEPRPGLGVNDRSMLVSSSGRIRNWLLRTVTGSAPTLRLQGFAAAPVMQEHAKRLTGGRGLLQRLQVPSEKTALSTQGRREQTTAGRATSNPQPLSKSTAAYIAARGSLRVTHRRAIAPGPPPPARSGNRVNGAASLPVQRASGNNGVQSAVVSAANGGNSRLSAPGSQQQGPVLGRNVGLTADQAPGPPAKSVGKTTVRTLPSADSSPRSTGRPISQTSAAMPFNRLADRSVESIGSAWQGDPLLLRFSLAERLIHKQASVQGVRIAAERGSAPEKSSSRLVTSLSGTQSEAAGRASSVRALQQGSTKPSPPVGGASVSGNQVTASRSTVQAASVVPRAGNAPGTPFGGRRLSGALALVAARLARWQALRTITIPRQYNQSLASSRGLGQPEGATRPVAYVTARRAAVPVTVHSRTPGTITAAAEDTAAGPNLARESRASQVHASAADTPAQQQRVEAEVVRQTRSSRPVLQAVRRSPALSQRQNPGTGTLSTRVQTPAPATPLRPAQQAMRRSPVLSQRLESGAGERTVQMQASVVTAPGQQRAGAEAEVVRRTQPPRPAQQAMLRSPAMSLSQNSGTGTLTARRATAQPVSRPSSVRSSVAQPLTGVARSAQSRAEQALVRSQSGFVPLEVATPPLAGHAVRAARMAESVTARAARQLPALLYKEETADRQPSAASSRPAERRPRVAARAVPLEFAVRSRAAAAGQAEQDRVVRQSLSRLEGEMKELRTKPAAPAVDVKAMTDQMYREITRRMRFEQQRRGL